MKLYTSEGKISKTVVISWLQILSALILEIAALVNTGDYSYYALLLFFNGVVMLVLRHYTETPLV
jgi:hypothetical protein